MMVTGWAPALMELHPIFVLSPAQARLNSTTPKISGVRSATFICRSTNARFLQSPLQQFVERCITDVSVNTCQLELSQSNSIYLLYSPAGAQRI